MCYREAFRFRSLMHLPLQLCLILQFGNLRKKRLKVVGFNWVFD